MLKAHGLTFINNIGSYIITCLVLVRCLNNYVEFTDKLVGDFFISQEPVDCSPCQQF